MKPAPQIQPIESARPALQAPRWGVLGLGLALSAIIGAVTPYNEMIVKGSRLGLSSLTPAAFFLFFIWLLCIHPLLRTLRPTWALSRVELLLIFGMMMVATAIPTRGVTGMMLSMISGSYYYVSSENGWADLVLPHTPTWMVVKGEVGLRHFYEGVPKGAPGECRDQCPYSGVRRWGLHVTAP